MGIRVEKKLFYPLSSFLCALYLIGLLIYYIYNVFDHSFILESNEIGIILSTGMIVITLFWYSNNGGIKQYFSDLLEGILGLVVFAAIIALFIWMFS